MMIEKILRSLNMLSADEQNLITELYFEGKSERQLSVEIGIHYMTLHNPYSEDKGREL